MSDLSPKVRAFLKRAGTPERLRVLVVLEAGELSTAELAERLGVSFDSADSAVRALVRVGLVEVVRSERSSETAQTMRRVYANRQKGWGSVRDAFEALEPPLETSADE